MLDLKQYSSLGAKVRAAQKRYFELIGKARKTKTPADYQAAKSMLSMSKELEKQFDQETDQLVVFFRAETSMEELKQSDPIIVQPLTDAVQ